MAERSLVPIAQVDASGNIFATQQFSGLGQPAPAMQAQPQVMLVPMPTGGLNQIPWGAIGSGFQTAAGLIQRANLSRLQEDADKKRDAAKTKRDLLQAAINAWKATPNLTNQAAMMDALMASQVADGDHQASSDALAEENARSALYTAVSGATGLATSLMGEPTGTPAQAMGMPMATMAYPQMQMPMMQMQPAAQQIVMVPNGSGGWSPALSGALAGAGTALVLNALTPTK